MKNTKLTILFLFLYSFLIAQSLDPTFQTNISNNTSVDFLEMPDGDIIVVGAFTSVNGQVRNHIARLNSQGRLSAAFDNKGFDAVPIGVLLTEDGKLLVWGHFTSYNGQPANQIIQLFADGTVDESFSTRDGFDRYVKEISLSKTGKIRAVGTFTNYNDTTAIGFIQLNIDGSLDNLPTPIEIPNGYSAVSIESQADNYILIGLGANTTSKIESGIPLIQRYHTDGMLDSTFYANSYDKEEGIILDIQTRSNGDIAITFWGQPAIGILNSNGDLKYQDSISYFKTTLDEKENFVFVPNTSNGSIPVIKIDSLFRKDTLLEAIGAVGNLDYLQDGRLLITGSFVSVGGAQTLGMTAFNLNDTSIPTVDFQVNLASTGTVNQVAVQTDGKVLISGLFHKVNQDYSPFFARLLENGDIDSSFQLTFDRPSIFVERFALQPDGKILITTRNLFEPYVSRQIYRLLPNGQLDESFEDNKPDFFQTAGFNAATFLADGKIMIATDKLLVLQEDGSIDKEIMIVPETHQVTAIAIQPDGKVLIAIVDKDISRNQEAILTRLNTDLTTDILFPSIRLGNATNRDIISITDLCVLPDETILVGGNFSTLNGLPINNDLLHLNQNGSIKLTDNIEARLGFLNNQGLYSYVEQIECLPNDLILINTYSNKEKQAILLDTKGTTLDYIQPVIGEINHYTVDTIRQHLYLGGAFTLKDSRVSTGLARINLLDSYISDSLSIQIQEKETCVTNTSTCASIESFAATIEQFPSCEGGLTYNWTIHSNNQLIAQGQGSSFEQEVEIGKTYQVEFSATNNCGHETTSQQSYTFTDCQAPIIEVEPGRQIDLNQAKELVFYPSDFIITATDNCSPAEDLVFKMTREKITDLSKEAILQLTDSITLNCLNFGTQEVHIYALDLAGNVSTKNVYIVLGAGLGNDGCGIVGPLHQVAGVVQNIMGEGIEDVTVSFKGHDRVKDHTDLDGAYTQILSAGNYDIIPSKEDNPMNGVSTFDQVLIQRHLLQTKPFTNKYQYIAADINLSSSISTYDLVLLTRMILGKELPFTEQESWIFVPTNYNFPASYSTDFPLSRTVQTSLEVDSGFDFIGIKRGDVNGNAIVTTNFHQTTSRNQKLLEVTTTDRWLEAGEIYTIPFVFPSSQSLSGFQLAISGKTVDLLALNKQTIENGLLSTEENLSWYATNNQNIRLNWAAVEPTPAVPFEITLLAEKDGYLSEQLQLSQQSFKNEAYTTDLDILSIGLSYQAAVPRAKKIIASLQPNLLTNPETQLIIEGLPSTTLFIRILSAQGQLIKQYQDQTTSNYYQQTLQLPDVPGIYWIQLRTLEGVLQTFKIVKI